jgi:phosphoribosyl-ATP pyrophosphohydrolase/phosphoribosyl-AMP cyclohydrolase/histidinol dehydrogenase
MRSGFAVITADLAQGIILCDRLAPEHLQVITRNARQVAQQCRHYGAVFIGNYSAEVLGDYGAGPNHTLPTGGSARFCGGLSVLHFLRVRTWIEIEEPQHALELYQDARDLALIEGLCGHANAASLRHAKARR